MRIALIASLVSPIREPQSGGAQAFLADLAAGLVSRGHEVDVFAASRSHLEGARCVDVGVDASTLGEFLYHPASAPPADPAPFTAAYSRLFERIGERSYDVIHNHAFDAPAIRLAMGIHAPVIHTLHLPPEASVIDALRDAVQAPHPPVIATVSRGQAQAWQQFIDIDVVLRPGVSTKRIPWSATPGVGLFFAGRFSPEKGVVDAIVIAQDSVREYHSISTATHTTICTLSGR